MKKIIMSIITILFLTGCSKNTIDKNYEKKDMYKAYAYNYITEQIELTYIEYELNTVEDVFNLYTKHQNNLPLGYVAKSSGNVGLLNCKIEDETCYYIVDKYITLVEDIGVLSTLLQQTNSILGIKETKIIYNDNIIS